MNGTKRRPNAIPAAAAGLASFALACRLDAPFAARWRESVSLPAMRALHRLTAHFPCPVLEPLALVAAGVMLWTLAGAMSRAIRGRDSRPLGRWLRGLMRGALMLVGCLALLWLPVRGASPPAGAAAAGAGELAALCGELIEALNAASPPAASPAAILSRAPGVAGMPGCVVKAARYPEWLRACRLIGLFAPPTGEAVVDATQPPPLLPFTAVHELMHLGGIADEGAANVAAWRRCLRAGGEFADSARLWALRYAMGRLALADEAARDRAFAAMGARLRSAYRSCGGDIPPTARDNYAALVDDLIDRRRAR